MDNIEQFNKDHPELLNADGTHKLADHWVLWSHAHDNNGWRLQDYRKHCVISTVESFWGIWNAMPSMINRDMWFLIREGIPPQWEAPINKQGGAFKFRVQGPDVDNTWLTLAIHLLSENMCLAPSDAELISGISVSPKKGGYCTISVWNLDSTRTERAIFPANIPGINFERSLYDPHDVRKCG